MGRLILHLGIHKTGSSAVQLWLLQNAEKLEKAGIVFPVKFVGPAGNGSKLAHALVRTADISGNVPTELRQRFLAFCKKHADEDVIVSAEDFENELLPSVKRAGGEGQEIDAAIFRERLGRHLDTVRAFADEAGFSGVTAVYLVRNIVDRASSAFAQRVKAIIHPEFNDRGFRPETARYHDRAAANLLMEEKGFEVAVDVLDPKAVSVVDQVMGLAGISDRVAQVASVETPRANESIGQLSVLAGLHLTELVRRGSHDDLIRRRRAMSLALRKASEGFDDDSFNGFTPADAKLVSELQAKLNDKLTPWLSQDRIAMIAQPKRFAPRSPLSIEELSDEQAETVRGVLSRVADAMCGVENAKFGYAREDIMAIGALPPMAEASTTIGQKSNSLTRMSAPGKANAAVSAADEKRKLERRQARQQRMQVAGKDGVNYPG